MTPPPFTVAGIECQVYRIDRITWAWHAGHLCDTAPTQEQARERATRAAEQLVDEAQRRNGRGHGA